MKKKNINEAIEAFGKDAIEAVDPTYAQAAKDDKIFRSHADKVAKEKQKEVDELTKQNQPYSHAIKKNKERKKLYLDESFGPEYDDKADVKNFQPWQGAKQVYDAIKEAGKIDKLANIVDELYPEGISEQNLNDLLWFEQDWIFTMLNMPIDESLKEYKSIKSEDEVVTIEAHRDGYSPKQVGKTMTVGELSSELYGYDEDTPVVISNDNGYTYGKLRDDDIDVVISESLKEASWETVTKSKDWAGHEPAIVASYGMFTVDEARKHYGDDRASLYRIDNGNKSRTILLSDNVDEVKNIWKDETERGRGYTYLGNAVKVSDDNVKRTYHFYD